METRPSIVSIATFAIIRWFNMIDNLQHDVIKFRPAGSRPVVPRIAPVIIASRKELPEYKTTRSN